MMMRTDGVIAHRSKHFYIHSYIFPATFLHNYFKIEGINHSNE